MTTEMTRVVPTLGAEGCILRAFRQDDLSLVLEASRDPFIPQITSVPADASTQQAQHWIALQHARVVDGIGYPFVIAAADSDEPLGQIGIWHHDVGPGRARIGYWVLARHRRHRVAGRALEALASWGLTLPGIVRLELYVEPWNEGSWRAAESAGFQREGLLRSWEHVGTERRDMFMYSRLLSDAA
jgi:ribosomal-protein-alanine N-acetyltransferase